MYKYCIISACILVCLYGKCYFFKPFSFKKWRPAFSQFLNSPNKATLQSRQRTTPPNWVNRACFLVGLWRVWYKTCSCHEVEILQRPICKPSPPNPPLPYHADTSKRSFHCAGFLRNMLSDCSFCRSGNSCWVQLLLYKNLFLGCLFEKDYYKIIMRLL